MSQEDEILLRLERGDSITKLDALNDPNIKCFNLPGRIKDLRKRGIPITTEMVRVNSGKRIGFYKLARRVEPSGQVLMSGFR